MATAVEQARVIFDCVDTSKDGVIDQSELGKLLEALGEDPTPQNIVRALFQLDTGGDGTISFDEFVSFYKLNYLPQHPTKLLTSRHGATAIGHSKSASYTLPPPTFCFGKALQRDKENAGQVLRQLGDASDDILSRKRVKPPQKRATSTRDTIGGGVSRPTTSAARPDKATEVRQVATTLPSEAGVAFVLRQLKAQLQSCGLQAFQKLSQQLQGGASALTFSAFKALVVETLHLSATEKDLRAVFGVFDANGDGTIQASEWVAALETPLEGNRLELVAHAFATLDPSHTGYVNLSTLRRQFDGSSLTEVVSGVRTIDEVRNEFLAAMANLSPTTSISWTHFAKHYTHVSSSIADDAAFTKAVCSTWNIAPPTPATNRPSRPGSSLAVDRPGTALPGKFRPNFSRVQAPWLSHDSASSLLYESTDKATATSTIGNAGTASHGHMKELDAGMRGIFTRIRTQLNANGVMGWMALCGSLTGCGDHVAAGAPATSYTKLSLQAFKDVMKHSVGVVLSDKDWRVIFEWFAVDNALDLRHVAKQLHSPLSATRLGMVRRAYRSLDVDKCGQVPQMDLLDRFDPAQHPSVVSGKATAVEATDLLKTVLPGPFVTAAQFEAYYGCVSQGIADDAVFEQHVTPLWASRFDDVRSEGRRSSCVSSIAKVGADDQAVGCIKKTPLELYHDSQQQLAAKSAAGKKPRPLTAAREKPKKLAQANKSNVEVDGSSPEQKHQPTSTKNRRVNSTSSRPSVIAAVSTAASVKKSKPTAANAKRKLQRVQS
ncbi:hypothetical protein H310_02472 [Aphanomyces invadans]|uniref:EF-hand domain-containing protein n=1 Tax=Aphanomyces invadans TaxID=157072 RepID=A0A024UQJ9_9STRA|nr:hypothetical protein H310_02472 [Aphanomyces invadans]ETW08132.1 hypothetical protein H310_02472 [Aphanomyces invadans]|eukprot:XP_008864225.1 hypothetical protein H310_02472 [Aphanomyces invadans]